MFAADNADVKINTFAVIGIGLIVMIILACSFCCVALRKMRVRYSSIDIATGNTLSANLEL